MGRHEIATHPPLRHLAKAARRHRPREPRQRRLPTAGWSWRWTFKVKGKTACVALSAEQATEMLQAIENHKRVEGIVREMREITQTLILETVPGIRRRKPLSAIPKAR
jgi:hypothetical protein